LGRGKDKRDFRNKQKASRSSQESYWKTSSVRRTTQGWRNRTHQGLGRGLYLPTGKKSNSVERKNHIFLGEKSSVENARNLLLRGGRVQLGGKKKPIQEIQGLKEMKNANLKKETAKE